ncbi:MAG: S26 family signal peptidase, partial [Bacteroidales bacterium]|nr:S26 family signal peptidase [Bacteroidales bacterium]
MATDNDNKKEKKEEEKYVRQTGSLKERLGRVKKTRWWRFGIVALIYVLWTIWMGNPWLLLGLLLLGDIYLTQFLPWGAWKGLENKTLRTIM